MRIREDDIRQIVREVIREGFSIKNFPREPIGQGEPTVLSRGKKEFSLLGGDSLNLAAEIKRRFRPHPGFSSWLMLHGEKPTDIVSEVTRWNPRLEKSAHVYRDAATIRRHIDQDHSQEMDSFNKRPGVYGEAKPKKPVRVFILLEGGVITGMFDEEAMTEYHRTPAGWRYYPGSASSPYGIWADRSMEAIENDGTWTITPEDAEEFDGYIDEATIVGSRPAAILIDLDSFEELVPSMTDGDKRMWEKFARDVELIDLPLLDLGLRLILPSSLVDMISSGV